MKRYSSTLESRTLIETKAFGVREDLISFSDGSTARHITAQHRGAVVIVPQSADGAFFLLRQYRHSIGKVLLEFPAGTLEKDEDPLLAAKRELIEEIQHSAEEWQHLGTQYPTPGFCSELQHCFFARKLKPQTGIPDEDEIIDVVSLTKREIEAAIISGEMDDAKSISIYTKAKLAGLV